MGTFISDLLGTLRPVFNIGRALFSTSGLTASRSIDVPDRSGTLLVSSDGNLRRTIGIVVDGSGSPLTTGLKGFLVAGFSGTITGWDVVADQTGSVVIDVWKVGSGSVPTVANKISASAGPSLSSQQINAASSVPTWTTSTVTLGDVLAFNIASVSTITRVVATIRLTGS